MLDNPQILSWSGSHIHQIEIYENLKSTNTYGRIKIQKGCLPGTVIWALDQTAGRGRRGRSWHAGQGSLTFSILWRVPDYSHVRLLPLTTGLGVVQALHVLTGSVRVKWPNDLWIGDKKVGGILGESFQTADGLWIILGIGINVNGKILNADFAGISLEEHTGICFSRFGVLNFVLQGIEESLKLFDRQDAVSDSPDYSKLNDLFRQYGNFLDKQIEIIQGGVRRRAIARRVLPDGGLLIEDEHGLSPVFPDEVSLRF